MTECCLDFSGNICLHAVGLVVLMGYKMDTLNTSGEVVSTRGFPLESIGTAFSNQEGQCANYIEIGGVKSCVLCDGESAL